MTMSVGYDIDRNIKNRDTKNLKYILNDIAKNQVLFVLYILARTLFAKRFETFTILKGCGQNGKSLIFEFMLETLKQYA